MDIDLTSNFKKDNIRELSNPTKRKPLRINFPEVALLDYIPIFKYERTSENELKKLKEKVLANKNIAELKQYFKKINVDLENIKKVNIAYPHKHSNINYNSNAGSEFAEVLKSQLEAAFPNTKWVLAKSIAEMLQLNRCDNQSSKHSIMNQQKFSIDETQLKDKNFTFLNKDNTEKEYFIVVDHCIEQGTTIMNLINYIEHNGGSIISAMTGRFIDCKVSLQTDKKIFLQAKEETTNFLSSIFSNSSRNIGKTVKIAKALHKSAKKHKMQYSPDECLDLLENGLQSNGSSLFAMTNMEHVRLLKDIKSNKWSFLDIMRDLKVDLPIKSELEKHLDKQQFKDRASQNHSPVNT